MDLLVALGVRGQRGFTTSGGFSGFSRWDLNTTETNFLFGKYQRVADLRRSKRLQAMKTSRKMVKEQFGEEEVSRRCGLGDTAKQEWSRDEMENNRNPKTLQLH